MAVELGSSMWFIAKMWISFDSIASQDLFEVTATYYGICNLAILMIISMYLQSVDTWSLSKIFNEELWFLNLL